MQSRTFIISECCSSWRFGEDHLSNAYRMILAAKECGADAAKFQWTSDVEEMARRRNDTNPANDEILAYPVEWLHKLKAKCDEVGIEFMVTCFLQKDIFRIAPLVERFKVASAESSDHSFVEAHFQHKKPVIISYAFGVKPPYVPDESRWHLACTCSYPTPIEQLNLGRLSPKPINEVEMSYALFNGLSDHSTSILSGALAVAGGSVCLEKHCRLINTPTDNPDFGHSLVIEPMLAAPENSFAKYVEFVRLAEKAMGTGENVIQECEKANLTRRVKI